MDKHIESRLERGRKQPPCLKCGARNRDKLGHCVACIAASRARLFAEQRPCRCGERDRNASGNCRPCVLEAQRKFQGMIDPHSRSGAGESCAVCKVTLTKTGPTRSCLDHDHETGRVRGWLCLRCNRAIGMFKEDPVTLRAAADYLDKMRAEGLHL